MITSQFCVVILDEISTSSVNFYLRWALAREGDYEMHHVCACVSVSHRFLQNYYSYRFFCQLIVLMNFHVLEFVFGFVDLGLKISE